MLSFPSFLKYANSSFDLPKSFLYEEANIDKHIMKKAFWKIQNPINNKV